MVQRRIPLQIYRPARAGVHSFAVLGACEAAARAALVSVHPILMYRYFGDAKRVSEALLVIGIAALICAALTPLINRVVPRGWLYTAGAATMIAGNMLCVIGGADFVFASMMLASLSLIVMTVCFNAYVMDYIQRTQMGKNEATRLIYSGIPWAVGPYLGIRLMEVNFVIPFLLSSAACVCLIIWFWTLKLGNGKIIIKSRKPAIHPLEHIFKFFKQPILVAGWSLATIRSIGWVFYLIYVPIFALEAGMSERIGGITASIANAALFLSPIMLWVLHRIGLRNTIITGCLGASALFLSATAIQAYPEAAIIALVGATIFLVVLDVSAGLPFLIAVKPSQRAEMASVYSTYRDVSIVLAPFIARSALAFAPVAGVFATGGILLVGGAFIASRLHPRLGRAARKPSSGEATRQAVRRRRSGNFPLAPSQSLPFASESRDSLGERMASRKPEALDADFNISQTTAHDQNHQGRNR